MEQFFGTGAPQPLHRRQLLHTAADRGSRGRLRSRQCAASSSSYVYMATGLAGKGMSGFVYAVNEIGARSTLSLPGGWTRTPDCWTVRWTAPVSRASLRRRAARSASRAKRKGATTGAFLLEALIATLIFAFGALAIGSLHARAARHLNERSSGPRRSHWSKRRSVRCAPPTPLRSIRRSSARRRDRLQRTARTGKASAGRRRRVERSRRARERRTFSEQPAHRCHGVLAIGGDASAHRTARPPRSPETDACRSRA